MVEKMSFLIKNSEVWEKYEDIWDVIKNKLNIKFHSQPIYENMYIFFNSNTGQCIFLIDLY